MQNKTAPAALLLFCFAACSSTHGPVRENPVEQIRIDNTVGRNWSGLFEKQLIFKKDPAIAFYLKQLTDNLVSRLPQLQETPITVHVVSGSKIGLRTYSFPGIAIYLSLDLLKRLELESELAAVISFELSNIVKRHLVKRVVSKNGGKSPEGPLMVRPGDPILDLTEEEIAQSMEGAIEILYQGHFDPRGALALIEFYKKDPHAIGLSQEALGRLSERVQKEVVRFPPLRNPVVRSDEFLQLKRRIEKL